MKWAGLVPLLLLVAALRDELDGALHHLEEPDQLQKHYGFGIFSKTVNCLLRK